MFLHILRRKVAPGYADEGEYIFSFLDFGDRAENGITDVSEGLHQHQSHRGMASSRLYTVSFSLLSLQS